MTRLDLIYLIYEGTVAEELDDYRLFTANSCFRLRVAVFVKKRLLDHLTSTLYSTPFNLPIPNSTLPRLHYFPYTTIFLMLSPCNKSPAFVFLIYQLPLILSITPSYSIVFPPGLAFPLFHCNDSLHISHLVHLL